MCSRPVHVVYTIARQSPLLRICGIPGIHPRCEMTQFRRFQGQLEIPQRQGDRNAGVSLIAGHCDRAGVSSRRNIGSASGDVDINPKGLVLVGGYRGGDRLQAAAQGRTGFWVHEGYQRLGIGSCAQGLVVSSGVETTLNGHIVFTIEDKAGGRDRRPVRPGERRGAHVDIAQATCGALYNHLSIHCLATRAG